MPTIKQLSRIFSQDDALNRVQDQLASALNPILRAIKGDLSGPLESPSVVGLQGVPIANITPTSGQVLGYNGTRWAPVAANWIIDVTATSPLVATTPSPGVRDIAIGSAVPATLGGTGLTSPGPINNVLVSDGTNWTSAVSPGGSPIGPAGGVLHGTYPNPDGLHTTSVGYFGFSSGTITLNVDAPDIGQVQRFAWFETTGPGQPYNNYPIGIRDSSRGHTYPATIGLNYGSFLLKAASPLQSYSNDNNGASIRGFTTEGTSAGDIEITAGAHAIGVSAYAGDTFIDGGKGNGGVPPGRLYLGTKHAREVRISVPSLEGITPMVYLQDQQVDVVTTPPSANNVLTWNGSKWLPQAVTYSGAAYPKFGHVAIVDSVNGNDGTGAINALPFLTVEAGLAAVATAGAPATLWIMPGTYTLASATTGLTIPSGCAIRGLSTQTVKIVMNAAYPGNTVTMLTMGESSRIEDVTLTLNGIDATTDLVGIHTPGTTSTTSKIRTCVITADNSALSSSTSTNVYGILDDGTGTLGPSSFSFNLTRGVTVNVFSNGGGNKRAVYVTTTNDITFRDTNFYVKAPVDSASTGSYVAVETTDASCSAQFRTCSISGPTTAGSYTGSDILQTAPTSGFVPYGIQLGPGCDLINRTAGGKPFTTYITPTTIDYGLRGNLVNSPHYLWPGVQTSADATEIFYRFQQKAICHGLGAYVRTAPGTGKTITITVRKSTTNVPGSSTATSIVATISGTNTTADHYTSSVDFAAGEYMSIEIDGTSGNAAQDLVVEVDLF